MTHQIVPIMLSLLIAGILGSACLVAFYSQSVNSTVKPYWVVIPILGIVGIIILLINTARRDRD